VRRLFAAVLSGTLFTAAAPAAEVFRDTPFFVREDGRMMSVDRIPADAEIVPLKATPDGKWIRLWWKEREGWIRARDVSGVNINTLRAPTAEVEAADSLSAENNTLRLDFSLQARRVGVGAGIAYFRRAPFLEFISETRFELGPAVYYFPFPSGATLLQAMLLVRGIRRVLGKLEVGGELGFVYQRLTVDDPFGFGDNVDNGFGAAFGPMGTYSIGNDMVIGMNIRVLLTSSSVNVQLASGVEYRF